MEADRRRNFLNAHGLALDIKDLAHQFLTTFALSAHVTAKHSYLRLAKSYHSAYVDEIRSWRNIDGRTIFTPSKDCRWRRSRSPVTI